MQGVISHRVCLSLIVYSSMSQKMSLQIPCIFLTFKENTLWTGVIGPVMSLFVVFIDLYFIWQKSRQISASIFLSY